MDEFETVTHEGWLSRLGGSIKGILFGFILLAAGVGLLFWGEGRAVKRAKALEEGASTVITVDASAPQSANESKLVHFVGEARTDERLQDGTFGIEADALKLIRKVEMYQWKENKKTKKKKKAGGGTTKTTTYSYEKVWSDSVISSSGFHRSGHDNPSSMPFQSATETASTITIGDWILSPRFVNQLDKAKKLGVNEEDLRSARERTNEDLRLGGGGFYLGSDPSSATIGDVRIRFSTVPPAEVSVVGQQQDQHLVPYVAKVGGDLAFLDYGQRTADEMFTSAKRGNTALTWALRLAGLMILWMGFAAILRPFSVAADVIPMLGNLVEGGIALVAGVLAVIVAFLTIAIGWLFYRPLLGILLIAAATVLIVWIAKKASQNPDIDSKWSGRSPSQPLPPSPPAAHLPQPPAAPAQQYPPQQQPPRQPPSAGPPPPPPPPPRS